MCAWVGAAFVQRSSMLRRRRSDGCSMRLYAPSAAANANPRFDREDVNGAVEVRDSRCERYGE